MDVYAISKFLFAYNTQPGVRQAYAEDPDRALAPFALSEEERTALRTMDFCALYEAGVPALLLTPLANGSGTGMPRYLEAIRKPREAAAAAAR